MSFTYFNAKLQNGIQQMTKELENACNGMNLSIGEVTSDSDGNYSEELFCEFLDKLVLADYPESCLYGLTTEGFERLDHEKDYLKTLLYVVIRSMQAKLQYFSFYAQGKPVAGDSFTELLRAFDGTDGWPIYFKHTSEGFEISSHHLLSANMEATVRSLYQYITGEEVSFPDPFLMGMNMPGETGEDRLKEEDTAAGIEGAEVSESAEDSEGNKTADESYDEDDPDMLFGGEDYWDEFDNYYEYSTQKFIEAEEAENYFYGNEKSRKAKEEDDLKSQEEMEENYGTRYCLNPKDNPKDKEIYDKQARRVMIFFQGKEEFVKKFHHLAEITKPGDEHFAAHLSKKVEIWLKDNDYTVYSDEEISDKVFDLLHAATREVLLWQGKKS